MPLCLITWSIFSQITPDYELVSELVQEKQKEIKQRLLKNLVVSNIETTNYATYNTLYEIVDILATEKNKTVMTRNLIREASNFAITVALANQFIRSEEYQRITNTIELDKIYDDSLEIKNLDIIHDVNKNSTTRINILRREVKLDTYEGKEDNPLIKGDNNDYVRVKRSKNDKTSLEANYIVDRLYLKLCKQTTIQVFEKNLLFQEVESEDFFTQGLDIDYDNLNSENDDNSYTDNLDKLLDDFIEKIADDLNNTEERVKSILNALDSVTTLKDLKELDNQVIRDIFDLLSWSLNYFDVDLPEYEFISKISEIITKYVIYKEEAIDSELIGNFKIDVESIILTLENEYSDFSFVNIQENRIGIKPYLTIGLNHGTFLNNDASIPVDGGSLKISDISYVGEKIGFKIIFNDYGYTRSKKPKEWFRYRGINRYWKEPQKEPLIHETYLNIFGSGIIYNIIDVKSEDQFDYIILGAGFGVKFFNNLDLNLSLAVPLIENKLSYDNTLINLGLEIPIFEYLKALRKKS